ncbi:pirin family protein [Burkholderia sp. F1]|uniref:pirin family protein n=1 Tax=Burkholderia sp. F1 TaxID=3366817 RepID=UPI003D719BDA
MFDIRRAGDRGNANQGWINSFFSFSFEEYYHDPEHTNFGALKALNEDFISPGRGFDMHSHDNTEIVTYMLQGELTQDDADGRHSVIDGGYVQRISAGAGVSHCGINQLAEPCHLLQIWLTPNVRDAQPRCEERVFTREEKDGKWCLLVSPDGSDGSLSIYQDARIYAGLFGVGRSATYRVAPGRIAYFHVARGSVVLDGQALQPGDAARIVQPGELSVTGGDDGEVILIDLPAEQHTH